jgi:LacI family transcriptional regulator
VVFRKASKHDTPASLQTSVNQSPVQAWVDFHGQYSNQKYILKTTTDVTLLSSKKTKNHKLKNSHVRKPKVSPSAAPATIQQIAEATGVSLMTVSRALNGKGLVAPKTESRILKVAQALRYRPNRLVHGLRTGQTSLIAAFFPADLGFYQPILRGVEKSLDAGGYFLLLNLIEQNQGLEAMREELRRLHRCLDMRIDGLILHPVNDDANAIYFQEIMQRKIPLVAVDRELPDFPCDFVGSDNVKGGAEAARRLWAAGSRRLLVLFAGFRVSASRDRRQGFLDEAERLGAEVRPVDCHDWEPSVESLTHLLQQPSARNVDGIFAVSDVVAERAWRALRALGRRCPQDVKIIGFGCLSRAEGWTPRLASFDQQPVTVGMEATRLLLERIKNPALPPRVLRMPTFFVPGDSL